MGKETSFLPVEEIEHLSTASGYERAHEACLILRKIKVVPTRALAVF